MGRNWSMDRTTRGRATGMLGERTWERGKARRMMSSGLCEVSVIELPRKVVRDGRTGSMTTKETFHKGAGRCMPFIPVAEGGGGELSRVRVHGRLLETTCHRWIGVRDRAVDSPCRGTCRSACSESARAHVTKLMVLRSGA